MRCTVQLQIVTLAVCRLLQVIHADLSLKISSEPAHRASGKSSRSCQKRGSHSMFSEIERDMWRPAVMTRETLPARKVALMLARI